MSDPCGGNETPPWSAPGPRPPPHGAGAVGLESRDTGRALPKARRHAPLDHGETAERGVLGHCPCQRHAHSHPGGQPLHPEAVRRSRCSRAAQNSRGVDEARADDAGRETETQETRGADAAEAPRGPAHCALCGAGGVLFLSGKGALWRRSGVLQQARKRVPSPRVLDGP